ncbi:4-(hydroxymethyl)benzenesulfonate dehydrogenase [hydrothermal vent metagenome]|uniref:4-(Hydroxymethyl)benzenesulfonate dehydrogenase n=1 Tax=hydrothermal vent metagenome TaxID=652676 RepID=A0A3B0T727_9ZZZZ
MSLSGKTAIVTGAASGFGLAIAEHFVRAGANVTVADLNKEGAVKVAGEFGGKGMAVGGDVSLDADVARMVAATLDRFGGLDIVVNNAGYTHLNQSMLTVSEEDFDRVFAVNVKSIFLMARHAVPHLKGSNGGSILNIGSTAGIRPRPGLAWYNASKGAVNLVTKSMAVELAPDRIRVNAIAPVAGETPLLARFMGGDTEEKRAVFRNSIPWGRLSQPRDVANAALFLVSDNADMITGTVLNIDGGRCI